MRGTKRTFMVCVAVLCLMAWTLPAMGQEAGKININTATLDQLQTLDGIGESYAKRIIEYRQATPFKQPEDLMNIKGIGEKTFEKIKDRIVVTDAEPAKTN